MILINTGRQKNNKCKKINNSITVYGMWSRPTGAKMMVKHLSTCKIAKETPEN